MSLLSLATAAGAVMVFVTQTVLARQLGPTDYGLFASSLATVSIIAPLAGFGLSSFRLRVYGAEGWAGDRWLRPSLHLSLITTALAFAIVIAWAFTAAPTQGTRHALLTLSPVILGVLATGLVGSKLRLEERYRALAGWQLLIPGGRLAVAISLLLLPGLTVDGVALGYCAISMAVFFLAMPQLRTLLRGEMELHGHGPRVAQPAPLAIPGVAQLWSQAWTYGLAAMLYSVFFQIGTVLLKYLDGDAAAGMYGIATAVMAAVYLIPTTIYQKFLLSKLHRWAVHDKPKFWSVYRKGIILMLGLGLAISLALVVLAPWLVPLMFGEAYRGVVGILLVLALCPPIRFLSTAIGSVLLSSTHMRYRVGAMGLAAAVTIALNLVLIPLYHELGAAFATIGGEIALFWMMYRGARSYSAEFR